MSKDAPRSRIRYFYSTLCQLEYRPTDFLFTQEVHNANAVRKMETKSSIILAAS